MHRSSIKLLTAALVVVLAGFYGSLTRLEAVERHGSMHVEQSQFGTTADGKSVELFTCTNANGVKLTMMSYGAIVVSLEVPDRDGVIANVNLGFGALDGYLAGHPYFGSTVGRYCNRIAGGKFSLDGKQYTLATNDGSNHLHGGDVGYDKVVWDARPIRRRSEVGVRFQYTSKDGEEGYPGLIVHGPMQATQLVKFAETIRGRRPSQFDFRSLSPIFDIADYTLNAAEDGGGLKLWTSYVDGPMAMEARATW